MQPQTLLIVATCCLVSSFSIAVGQVALRGAPPEAPAGAAACISALQLEPLEGSGDAVAHISDSGHCMGGGGGAGGAMECRTLLMIDLLDMGTAAHHYTIISSIRRGDKSYTFLVPPENVLEERKEASVSGTAASRGRDWSIDSLLLNVLVGNHTLESLNSAAQTERSVITAIGEQLRLLITPSGDLQIGFGGQIISVDSTQYNSCKATPPSVILSTSDMLEHSDVIYADSATEARAAPAASRRSVKQIAEGWFSSNFWALLATIVLFLALGYYVARRARRLLVADRRSFMETEGQMAMRVAEIARMAEEDAAQMRRIEAARAGPPLPPTVLRRLDTKRWTTVTPMPRISLSRQLSRDSSLSGELPSAGSSKSLKLLKQRSVRSTTHGHTGTDTLAEGRTGSMDVDTCGLKYDAACTICYENEGDHVLLPCGHGGYCGECAHTLITLPPAQRLCPICRSELQIISKVQLSTPVGAQADVLEAAVAKTVYTVESESEGEMMEDSRDGSFGDRSSGDNPDGHYIPPQ